MAYLTDLSLSCGNFKGCKLKQKGKMKVRVRVGEVKEGANVGKKPAHVRKIILSRN